VHALYERIDVAFIVAAKYARVKDDRVLLRADRSFLPISA
jgi:hypothetical protein